MVWLFQVKEQGFSGFERMDRIIAGDLRAGSITCQQGRAIEGQAAAHDLEPKAPAWPQLMRDGLAWREAQAVDFRILMDGGRIIAAIRRDHEDFGIAITFGFGMPLCITGGEASLRRQDPDLQQVEVLFGGSAG